MYYNILLLILLIILIFFCVRLKFQNIFLKNKHSKTLIDLDFKIKAISKKQSEIFNKVKNNTKNGYNEDLKTLTDEVLELHKNFIKKHIR